MRCKIGLTNAVRETGWVVSEEAAYAAIGEIPTGSGKTILLPLAYRVSRMTDSVFMQAVRQWKYFWYWLSDRYVKFEGLHMGRQDWYICTRCNHLVQARIAHAGLVVD